MSQRRAQGDLPGTLRAYRDGPASVGLLGRDTLVHPLTRDGGQVAGTLPVECVS